MSNSNESLFKGNLVRVRPFTNKDITNKYLDWLRDPLVTRFSNQRFLKHDYESCLDYLNSFDGTRNLFLAIDKLEEKEIIGTLTCYISSHHHTVDVGILIGDHSIWGKGYGQDTWNSTLNWLIKDCGYHKITAGTARPNQGMISLMERSNMELEAVKEKQELIEGRFEDLLYYSIFNPSFRIQQST